MSIWTTKLRGPALGLTLGTALMIAVAPVQAAAEKQKSSKAENIGVMSGLVIGAAAGGPIGAVVGAVGVTITSTQVSASRKWAIASVRALSACK